MSLQISIVLISEMFKKVYINISLLKFKSKCTSAKMKIEKMASVTSCFDACSPQKAAELLCSGQVIAVPTDTVYGLACSANCPDAIQKLYAIKGRDAEKPVAICVARIQDIRKWGEAQHLQEQLLQKLVPGPITIVLQKSQYLNNPFLNPQMSKIGIRIPKHEFMNDVTKLFDMPVALTSANFSNEPSTLSVLEFKDLYRHLGAVFDGGVLSQGLQQNRTGSTVVDLSKAGVYNIIRKGISCNDIVNTLESFGWKSMFSKDNTVSR